MRMYDSKSYNHSETAHIILRAVLLNAGWPFWCPKKLEHDYWPLCDIWLKSQTQSTKSWMFSFVGIIHTQLLGDYWGIENFKSGHTLSIITPVSRHILISAIVTVTVSRQQFSSKLSEVPHHVIHRICFSNTQICMCVFSFHKYW